MQKRISLGLPWIIFKFSDRYESLFSFFLSWAGIVVSTKVMVSTVMFREEGSEGALSSMRSWWRPLQRWCLTVSACVPTASHSEIRVFPHQVCSWAGSGPGGGDGGEGLVDVLACSSVFSNLFSVCLSARSNPICSSTTSCSECDAKGPSGVSTA